MSKNIKHYLWKIKNIIFSLLSYKTIGARAIVINDGKVLLVRHTYMDSKWYTVGGGVEKGETPMQAVKRELMEEVGVRCLQMPRLFGVYYSNYEKRDDYVVLYIVDKFEQEHANSTEILEMKWFPLQQLPADISLATKRRIDEFLGIRVVEDRW